MASSSINFAERLSNSIPTASDRSVHAIPASEVISTNEVPGEGHPQDEEKAGNSTQLGGYRLYAVAIGVLFGSLMMAMDISIIGTVRSGLVMIQCDIKGWHGLTDLFSARQSPQFCPISGISLNWLGIPLHTPSQYAPSPR
jgi:hypothetical protein